MVDAQTSSSRHITLAQAEGYLTLVESRETLQLSDLGTSAEVSATTAAAPDPASGGVRKSMKWAHIRGIIAAVGVGYLFHVLSNRSQTMDALEVIALAGQIGEGLQAVKPAATALANAVNTRVSGAVGSRSEAVGAVFRTASAWLYNKIILPLGVFCKHVALSIRQNIASWGNALLERGKNFLTTVNNAAGAIKAKVGLAFTWWVPAFAVFLLPYPGSGVWRPERVRIDNLLSQASKPPSQIQRGIRCSRQVSK